MTSGSELIDEIVRNVMRELNLPSTADSAALSTQPAGDAVVLTDTVITEDLLAESGAAGGTIVLPEGAVITPSGRDYLRRYQIQVSSSPTAATGPDHGLVIIVGEASGMAAAARSVGWSTTTAGGCFDAANQTVQRCTSDATICCTPQPSVTACLINRNGSRRAAVLTADTCLSELFRQMNPDTVCLTPDGWSFGQLTRLLRRFGSRSAAVPAGWRELS